MDSAERALFVIGKDGIITWNYLSPISVNPGADGILEALENLAQAGEAHDQAKVPVSPKITCRAQKTPR